MRTLCLAIVALVLSISTAQAEPKPSAGKRMQHADRNDDGVVTAREMQKEKQFEHKQRSTVNQPWEERADADGDGKVEPVEARAYRLQIIDLNKDGTITVEERRAFYGSWKRVVNTEAEKKYDANGSGYLEWPEAREFLKDRLTIVNTDGKAIVNTDIEREFDDNGDGVIDAKEAAALKEVLD